MEKLKKEKEKKLSFTCSHLIGHHGNRQCRLRMKHIQWQWKRCPAHLYPPINGFIITSTRYYEWEYTSTLLFILTCTYSPLSFSYYCTTIQFYMPYTLQICYLLLVVIVVHQILFCHLKKILWQFFAVQFLSSLPSLPLLFLYSCVECFCYSVSCTWKLPTGLFHSQHFC